MKSAIVKMNCKHRSDAENVLQLHFIKWDDIILTEIMTITTDDSDEKNLGGGGNVMMVIHGIY